MNKRHKIAMKEIEDLEKRVKEIEWYITTQIKPKYQLGQRVKYSNYTWVIVKYQEADGFHTKPNQKTARWLFFPDGVEIFYDIALEDCRDVIKRCVNECEIKPIIGQDAE